MGLNEIPKIIKISPEQTDVPQVPNVHPVIELGPQPRFGNGNDNEEENGIPEVIIPDAEVLALGGVMTVRIPDRTVAFLVAPTNVPRAEEGTEENTEGQEEGEEEAEDESEYQSDSELEFNPEEEQ